MTKHRSIVALEHLAGFGAMAQQRSRATSSTSGQQTSIALPTCPPGYELRVRIGQHTNMMWDEFLRTHGGDADWWRMLHNNPSMVYCQLISAYAGAHAPPGGWGAAQHGAPGIRQPQTAAFALRGLPDDAGVGAFWPIDPYQLGKNAGGGIVNPQPPGGGATVPPSATNFTPWIIGGVVVVGIAGYVAYKYYSGEMKFLGGRK